MNAKISANAFRNTVLLLGFFYSLSFPVTAFQKGAIANKINPPQLVLLRAYDNTQEIDEWLVSEKLDGIRAYWDGQALWSRSGNRSNAPAWFTEDFPPFEIDGELWIKRNEFSKTVSIVQKKEAGNDWKKLTFQIFEVPNQPGGLLERLHVLELYLERFPAPYIRIIDQEKVHNRSDINARLKHIIAIGGEGLVLRNPETPYYSGRTGNALKVKQKQDAECIVVGYTKGKGKYLGMTGALKCELLGFRKNTNDDGNSTLIKVGSGLSDALRKTPPVIGAKITFQYMGLTSTGLPRFPVYLRVRSIPIDLDLDSPEFVYPSQ